VVDTLSRRHLLLSTFETKLFGLEFWKEMYPHDSIFVETFVICTNLAPMDICLKKKDCVWLSVPLGIF